MTTFLPATGHAQEVLPPPPAGTATEAHSATFEPEPAPVPRVVSPPSSTKAESLPPRLACPECPPSPPTNALRTASDPDAVFRAFDAFAEQQQGIRIAGGIGAIVAGGTTMAVGTVLAEQANASPQPWLIIGGVTAGFGVLGLILPSSAEDIQGQFRTGVPGHSEKEAALFERAWAGAAARARSQRHFNAVFNFVLGAASAGVGIAFLGGAVNMSEEERTIWGSVLVGSGAGLGISGATSLFVASPIESAYAQYVAAKPGAPSALSVGTFGVPGGMAVRLSGAF